MREQGIHLHDGSCASRRAGVKRGCLRGVNWMWRRIFDILEEVRECGLSPWQGAAPRKRTF